MPGSYLALSHGTDDYRPEDARAVSEVYTRASHTMRLRSRAQIAAMLDGYELVNPATEKVIGVATLADAEDARRAIAAAKRAFPAFSRSGVDERIALIPARYSPRPVEGKAMSLGL